VKRGSLKIEGLKVRRFEEEKRRRGEVTKR
jgi:hypothetical protein